jgi:hypothetical protein
MFSCAYFIMEGGAFVAGYIPLQCVIDEFLLGYFSFSTTAQHKKHLFFILFFLFLAYICLDLLIDRTLNRLQCIPIDKTLNRLQCIPIDRTLNRLQCIPIDRTLNRLQ